MPTAEAVIIGGGSTGTSIAFHLAQRGLKHVTLIDQLGLAAGATGRSTAVVRTHYPFEPLARMAVYSLRFFQEFAERVGGPCGFTQTGFLVIAGPDDTQALEAAVQMNTDLGIRASVLSPAEIAAIEPRVACADDVALGAWEPASGRADPHTTTQSFGDAARRLGADLRLGVTVTEVVVRNGQVSGVMTTDGLLETATVVVAAGCRSRELVAPHGLELPLVPVRHSIGIVQRTSGFGPSHPIVSDRVVANYYVPEGNDLTLIGSNAAWAGTIDADVEADRQPEALTLEHLGGQFLRRFPTQADAGLRGGFTGIYDCSPDLQPLLGPVAGIAGLYVAAGFSGHGFKLCPAVGELMAEHILTGRTTLVDLAPFSPLRFANNQPIRPAFSYSHQIEGIGAPNASLAADA